MEGSKIHLCASSAQAMALADVREIMDTCSLGQALDLLKTKAVEQPLRSLVERSAELQQAWVAGSSQNTCIRTYPICYSRLYQCC